MGKTIIKKTDEFEVYIEGALKCLRSRNYNYDMNLINGHFRRWGAKKEDDPPFSHLGPEIFDCEITDICSGGCSYCYKSNTANGTVGNMSLNMFREIIDKVNPNQILTQVAFGLGSSGEENPDVWKMCEWLRSRYIIPNGTVADISVDTAEKIVRTFGACAVSAHTDWTDWLERLSRSVSYLSTMASSCNENKKDFKINCHFVLSNETLPMLHELIQRIEEDKRAEKAGGLQNINAIVLLGLKECGRALKSNHKRVGDEDFEKIVQMMLGKRLGFGFDSCSQQKYESAIRNIHKKKLEKCVNAVETNSLNKQLDVMIMLSEPCESGLFSAYSNVEGKLFPCSFAEQEQYEFDVLNAPIDFMDYWNGTVAEHRRNNRSFGWRNKLLANNRKCPIYNI